MSAPNQFTPRERKQNPIITAALFAGSLILGIPVAAAALGFEKVYMPNIILGTKTIKDGIDSTKTISFSLLSGPNDDVMAGAYMSIIFSVLLALGFVVIRHLSRHNIFGWLVIGPAVLNLLAQIGVVAYAFIVQGSHPQADNASDVPYENGTYNTNGKLYTKEAWACMMDKFYHDREGDWAKKACSDFKTGRMLTIAMLATAILMAALAFWQIQTRGGFGWLFGRRKSVAREMGGKKETEYIGLDPSHA